MLPVVSSLFEQLNAAGVRYSHWKSNWVLEETLEGATDLDLLVHRSDAPRFRAILQGLGFRPAVELGAEPLPSVEHHQITDEAGPALVDVHAYYRVITGGSLAKSHRLPLEELLLEHVRRVGAVNVPSKGAELVVFVLRMSLKHTGLFEPVMLRREWDDVRREVAWLATEEAQQEAEALLRRYLPGFDPGLFRRALEALRRPSPAWRRTALGYRVRAELRPFARHGAIRAEVVGARKLTDKALHRLDHSRRGLTPAGGGAVIAFVGAEATGKSTMLDTMERWLGAQFTVRRVHAGKPPGTALTALPNLLLPALRRLAPEQRSTHVAARDAPLPRSEDARFPLLFGVRSVLLAYDRRALLTAAFAHSTNGAIVLCDRYPSADSGAPDSPQLARFPRPPRRRPLRRLLAHLEARLYQDIPAPDLVVYLTAPLELTLERNRARSKVEDEEYVRQRYVRSSERRFERVRVHRVDTSRPLDETTREIRQVIWNSL